MEFVAGKPAAPTSMWSIRRAKINEVGAIDLDWWTRHAPECQPEYHPADIDVWGGRWTGSRHARTVIPYNDILTCPFLRPGQEPPFYGSLEDAYGYLYAELFGKPFPANDPAQAVAWCFVYAGSCFSIE
jgi:hypothetical protein